MSNPLRQLVKDTALGLAAKRLKAADAVKTWREQGEPNPPPHLIKEQIVSAYQSTFKAQVLVETGTYMGDMLSTMRPFFDRLISIELSEPLAAQARVRFKRYPKIQIVQGDSGEKLPEVLHHISEPILFWLDGHYSGGFTARAALDTPVVDELRTIFAHPVKNHIILIDDARLFNGTDDYPTIEELEMLVHSFRPDYQISVRHDVIRAHPPITGILPDV